jgi:hypothetical protein
MAPDRSFVNDVTLSGAGAGAWIVATAVLAALAAAALAGLMMYRRRYERFRNPP